MSSRVVIVGAGVGGLAAATLLARAGCEVTVVEARATAGGLASTVELDGLTFDVGPYVLLDRAGLEHALGALGIDVADLALRRIEDVLSIAREGGPEVRLAASAELTAQGFDRAWPGSGARWLALVAEMSARHARLAPSLVAPRPGLVSLMRGGAWRDVPFLLRPLASAIHGRGLPPEIEDACFIWTRVAGQRPDEAPSPLAFVPSIIHGVGAWLPAGGMGSIARRLEDAARAAGAAIVLDAPVASIECRDGRARGVRLASGERLDADAVVSNVGPATFERLVPSLAEARERMRRMPLQSPGTCVSLAVRGVNPGPYLRFRLREDSCELLVLPSLVDGALARDGWSPARLIAPMPHASAERLGERGQRELALRLIDDPWWRDHVADARVLDVRAPVDWGREFRLHRDAMNPVMTSRLMRAGRMPHRVRGIRGLAMAGSSTHPGQWVSLCAISGLHAARVVLEDLAR